jgi:hypothetical protein
VKKCIKTEREHFGSNGTGVACWPMLSAALKNKRPIVPLIRALSDSGSAI